MSDIIDYAMPTMKAERALLEMHRAVLEKDYERAIELSVEATKWCGVLTGSLVVMNERDGS